MPSFSCLELDENLAGKINGHSHGSKEFNKYAPLSQSYMDEELKRHILKLFKKRYFCQKNRKLRTAESVYGIKVSKGFLYYPFGSSMVSYSNTEYHYSYGFNSQEKVDEISGSGNHYTATHWEYDARLGRRWNQDPKPNPSISNYAAFANNPIWYSDHEGDTIKIAYKDKTGLGRIFEKNKYMVYTPEMEYTGNNQFVSDAVNSLNYVCKNNADVHGIIKKSAESTEIVKVKKGNSDYYDPRKLTITWSKKGMTVWDNSSGTEVLGRQS